MSFNHKTVKSLEATHQRAIERIADTVETMSEEKARHRARIMREVDGLPVSIRVAEFCDEVRRIHRNVRFAVEGNPKSQWENSEVVVREIWAYFPGDEYAFMRLGHADYSVRDGSGNKYGVYTRNIKNEKFNEDREQYHMAMADTLERAVKNVKKFMRRYSVGEVAGMRLFDFQNKVSSAGWTASSAVREARETLANHPSLATELQHMINTGYQFNCPLFANAVRNYVEAHAVDKEKQNQQHHAYYVSVSEEFGEQVFNVVTVLDVKRAHIDPSVKVASLKGEELSTVDEELPHKLATLSMLEAGNFIEGLGIKVNDRAYWVMK